LPESTCAKKVNPFLTAAFYVIKPAATINVTIFAGLVVKLPACDHNRG